MTQSKEPVAGTPVGPPAASDDRSGQLDLFVSLLEQPVDAQVPERSTDGRGDRTGVTAKRESSGTKTKTSSREEKRVRQKRNSDFSAVTLKRAIAAVQKADITIGSLTLQGDGAVVIVAADREPVSAAAAGSFEGWEDRL